MLNVDPILRYQHVFLEGLNIPVLFKLLSAIVVLRRLGERLDDDKRID